MVYPISGAEAAARLFAHTLNPLAHIGDGLEGAIEITKRCAHFELVTADLPETCALVRATLEGLYAEQNRGHCEPSPVL